MSAGTVSGVRLGGGALGVLAGLFLALAALLGLAGVAGLGLVTPLASGEMAITGVFIGAVAILLGARAIRRRPYAVLTAAIFYSLLAFIAASNALALATIGAWVFAGASGAAAILLWTAVVGQGVPQMRG